MYLDINTTFTPRRAIAAIKVALKRHNSQSEQLFKSLELLEPVAKEDITSCLLLTRARQWLQEGYHNERRAVQELHAFSERLTRVHWSAPLKDFGAEL